MGHGLTEVEADFTSEVFYIPSKVHVFVGQRMGS